MSGFSGLMAAVGAYGNFFLKMIPYHSFSFWYFYWSFFINANLAPIWKICSTQKQNPKTKKTQKNYKKVHVRIVWRKKIH